jgi:hypothetical protein
MADGFVHIRDVAAPILKPIFEQHRRQNVTNARKPTPAEIARRTPLGGEPIPARSSNEEYRARYVRELSGGANPGRKVKFTKDGEFVTADDGLSLPKAATYRFLGDETEISWIKFNGPGTPPERRGGLLYSDYRLPDRGDLGDDDESQWETGLGGKPQDPWQHQISLSFEACAWVHSGLTALGHPMKRAYQSGSYWRFGRFAGDRCRVQVQTQCASERFYCPSSVDRSASRTVSRPLRVFVPSNAADDCIDSTWAAAFRSQVYKVGLHIAYDGRNRHPIAGMAPRSGVGKPRNVGRCDCKRDGNEPAQRTTAKERWSLMLRATQEFHKHTGSNVHRCCIDSHNYEGSAIKE